MYKTPRRKSLFLRIFDTVRLREDDDLDNDIYDEEDEDLDLAPDHLVEDTTEDDYVEEDPEGELGIDMYQTHNAIVIQAITAGVKLSDIDIDLTREHVTIRGTRTPTHRVSEEDFFNQEIYWGAFSRSVQLPFEVDIDQAEAIEDHGLLTITLPKLNKDRRAALKVKSI